MQAFELTILNWIQAHLRCGVLDAVMVPVSQICDHGEVWILLAAILLAIPKTRKLGTCVACGLALDLLFCNLALKPLIGRMRPFAVNPTISLLIPPPVDASFPSGHTAASFASVAALKTANSRLWKPALALAVVIASICAFRQSRASQALVCMVVQRLRPVCVAQNSAGILLAVSFMFASVVGVFFSASRAVPDRPRLQCIHYHAMTSIASKKQKIFQL